MDWTIEVSAAAARDIDLLFDHLAESYAGFGDDRSTATARAVERIETVLDQMTRIASAPHRGAAHDDMLPDLRHLTIDRAIHWYRLNEPARKIQILAIFYGAQDHIRHMLLRLLEPEV